LTLAWNGNEFWYREQPERIPPTHSQKITRTSPPGARIWAYKIVGDEDRGPQVHRGEISCFSSPPETGEEPHEFAEDEERPPRTEIGLAKTGKASRASSHAPAKKYEEPQ
jgi:hypothetical protein